MEAVDSSQKRFHQIVIEILKLTIRIWFSDLSRSLGSKRNAYIAISISILILMCVGGFSAVQGSSISLGTELLTPEGAASLCALLFTLPGISTVLAQVYSPPRTLITEMLVVLPVNKKAARFSVVILAGTLGLFLGILFLSALALPIINIIHLFPLTIIAISLFPILGVSVALCLLLTFSSILRIFKIHNVAAEAISALITALIFGWCMLLAMPINYNVPNGPHSWVSAPFLRFFAGLEPASTLFTSIPIFLLAFFAITFLTLLSFEQNERMPSASILKSHSNNSSLIKLEIIQILRFTPNIVAFILVNCIGLVLFIFHILYPGSGNIGLGTILLLSISCWGVGAFGPTKNHHWIYSTSDSNTRWIWPKFLAVLALWSTAILAHGSWIVLFTEWNFIDFAIILPILFIEVIAACSIGIIFPITGSNSISGTISESMGIAISFGISLSLQSLIGTFDSLLGIVSFYLILIIISLYTYRTIGIKASMLKENV